jgi:hypothetical protein
MSHALSRATFGTVGSRASATTSSKGSIPSSSNLLTASKLRLGFGLLPAGFPDSPGLQVGGVNHGAWGLRDDTAVSGEVLSQALFHFRRGLGIVEHFFHLAEGTEVWPPLPLQKRGATFKVIALARHTRSIPQRTIDWAVSVSLAVPSDSTVYALPVSLHVESLSGLFPKNGGKPPVSLRVESSVMPAASLAASPVSLRVELPVMTESVASTLRVELPVSSAGEHERPTVQASHALPVSLPVDSPVMKVSRASGRG